MERYKKITRLVSNTRNLVNMMANIDNMYSKEDIITDIYIKCCEKNITVDNISYVLVKNHIKNMIRNSLSMKRDRNKLILSKEINLDNIGDGATDFVESILEDTCETNCLTLKEYKIFELYYRYGYTHEEIGRKFKLNRVTISSILAKCRDKIKKEME